MKKILYIKLLSLVLFLSTPFVVLSQDNEPDIKEQADKFFTKENYVEATPLYLRLLALNPKSYEYNYKYGTCILYNSRKKTDAFKYLNFAVTGADVSPDAFYYLGKAYHLNYQFNDAVKNYELYKQKVGSNIKAEFEVDRHIQMCQNGKGLLTSISDIVVLEKKEYEAKKFFDLYKLDNIGGVIILTTDYQSKADKKRNHVPIIHFPNNPDRIYYSSYGDDKSNMDIYVRTKLPNGEWSLAQTLNGAVNTSFDEDFPYMSPDGRYLYFSSKGHNSMGGYDIFRSKYDPETNSFGTPENMDFAISSADNDLFYVVDSLEQNAYFASSRQSLNGNYYVYKVKVDRVPSQLAIVKGAFSSTVNPENKKVSIKVTDLASGTKIGDFKSNEKGNYLITFPKGGKYEYEMKVEGSENIYKYTANIPYLKEFKPLKQKIFEEKQDAGSLVRVVDLFNEEVEDPQGVIVEVIRAKSELNVNANQFNLDELDAQKNNKKVLANLGLENASNAEIQTKFDGIEQKKEEQAHQVTQLHNGAIEQAVRNTEEIAQNQKEIKTLVAQANNAETDANKLAILKQAEEKIETIESLTNQNIQLKKLADSLAPLISKENSELKRISDVNKAVQESLQKNDMTALQTSIEKEADLLNKISNTKVEDPADIIENKKALVNEEKNKLLEKQKEYETTARALTNEITQLETSLTTAKSKEKPLIQQKIDGKKAEKDLLDQEIKKLDGKIAEKTKEADRLNDEIVFLESITSVSLDPVRNSNEIKAAMDKVDDPNSRSLQNYVKEEVKKIATKVENNPDPKELISSVKTNLDNEETKYNEAQEAAKNDANLSEEDKLNASISNAQEFLNNTQTEKKKISTALAKNPDNSELKEQASLIETKENELKNSIAATQQELDKLKNPTNNNSTSLIDKTELVNSIYPDYKTDEAKLPEDPKAKLAAQNTLDENLIAKLDKEEKALEKKAKSNPNDEQTKAKLAAVKELKEEKKAVIDERKAEIAQLTNAGSNGTNGSNGSDPNNSTTTTSIDKTELVNSIYPDYKTEEAKLPEDPKAKLTAQNTLDENLIAKLDKEEKALEKKAKSNPNDEQTKAKLAAVKELKEEKKAVIDERKAEIAQLANAGSNGTNGSNGTDPNNSTSTVDKTELVNSIYPDYKTEEAKLPEDPKEKLTAQNTLDENLIAKLDKEEKALEKKAKSDPNDEQTKAKLAAVKELKEEKKAVIDERKAEIAQLANAGSNGTNGSNGTDPNNSSTNVDKTELVNSIYPDYKTEEAKLPEDPKAKLAAQNTLDENLIAKLDKEEKALEKKAKSNPNDEQTKAKLAAVKELKEEKKAVIDERKAEIAQLSNGGSNGTDPTNTVQEIDPVVLSHEIYPEYQEVNFDNQSKWSEKDKTDLLLEEEKLRTKLLAEKKANDKKLEKKSDPAVEAENRAIQQLIDQSERNTERINSNESNVAVENAINEDLKERAQDLMYGKTTSESDGTQKIKELEDYERNLLNSIDNLKEDEVNNNATIQIREEQLKKVRQRIGQIEMDLEELKTLNSSTPEVQKALVEANELKEKETVLENKLATATPSEKKKIEKELSQNRQAQEKKQVEIEKAQVASLTVENEKDLNNLKSDEELTKIAQHAVDRSKDADENVLTSSTHAQNLIQSIEQYSSGQDVFNSTGTVIHTEDALVQQQRSFSIEIGEIEQEINNLGTSKKDLAKKKELENQKATIEKANNTVLEQLKEIRKDKQPIVDNTNELNTQVSFEEEQAIAANEKYTQALELNQKVKETEVEIIAKNKEIDEKKKELEQTTDVSKRQELIQDIVKLTADKKSLENKLNSTNKELNDLILSESSTPMKWRNVLMREVAPAAVLVVSSFVEPSVVKGFELNTKENPKAKTAIPVDLKAPGGLVYRVQVGAFAKPLRKELFTEFSLVTGEKLANGITRYLAGYFGSRSKVVEAQSQIKSLGYKDAFVVAYCDGKRISLAEAKRLEELGLCVPKDQNSIAFDVANSMIAKLPKDSLKRIAPTRKFDDYNKAPGAAEAEAVENRKGLFYTVQIGVYNSPVTSEKVRNIQPLITKRLENGQIRYSSGVFTSVEEAQPKKAEAIERGIKDAFITAYYNGERISLAEAERILSEKGKVVSETQNLTKTTSVDVSEAKKYTEQNPIVSTEKKTYQLVSKETYTQYPRDLINRYNNAGSFYYDISDNKIKSVVYTNEYRVPTNDMFENKMDTVIRIQGVDVYEPNTKKVVAEWGTFELPGELGNQLLHLSLPYSVDLTDLGCVIVFESVHEFKVDALVEELKKMSARTVEVKEMF